MARSEVLTKILKETQDDSSSLDILKLKLVSLYNKSPVGFSRSFMVHVSQTLVSKADSAHLERIMHVIVGVVITAAGLHKATVSSINGSTADALKDESEDNNILTFRFLNVCVQYSNHEKSEVRKRCVQYIYMFMSEVHPNVLLSEKFCAAVIHMMLYRIKDKVPAIRCLAIQAVFALQENESCPVIRAMQESVKLDSSAEVRRQAVRLMSLNSLSAIRVCMDRTKDTSSAVRREAYERFAIVNPRLITIQQRRGLLKMGLGDDDEKVQNVVKERLLPAWFRTVENNYLKFLQLIDLCSDVIILSQKILMTLFSHSESKYAVNLMRSLLDEVSKMIPLDHLTCEMAFFWHCYVYHTSGLVQENNDFEWCDEYVFDPISVGLLPDMTTFSRYVLEFCRVKYLPEENRRTRQEYEFILAQLIQLCKTYDFNEEFGRNRMSTLCLKSMKVIDMSLIPEYMELFIMSQVDIEEGINAVCVTVDELLNSIDDCLNSTSKNVDTEQLQNSICLKKKQLEELHNMKDEAIENNNVNEIYNHDRAIEKIQQELNDFQNQLMEIDVAVFTFSRSFRSLLNDTDDTIDEKQLREQDATLRSLLIFRALVDQSRVNFLTLPLRHHIIEFIGDKFQSGCGVIEDLAAEVLGSLCLRDKEMAAHLFSSFMLKITRENIGISGLKVVFDLLVHYDPALFGLDLCNKEYLNTFDSDSDSNGDLDVTLTLENSEGESASQEITNEQHLLHCFDKFLSDQFENVRHLVVHGLCKLFMNGKIKSVKILSHLFVVWFNPVTEHLPELRICLNQFFLDFIKICSWSTSLIVNSLIPVLNQFWQAPVYSRLKEVDTILIIQTITELTHPSSTGREDNGHIDLAVIMCKLVPNMQNVDYHLLILKGLDRLDLSMASVELINSIIGMMDKCIEIYRERKLKKQLQDATKFRDKLKKFLEQKECEESAGPSTRSGYHRRNTTAYPIDIGSPLMAIRSRMPRPSLDSDEEYASSDE